jgi:hypothetical protein
MMLTSRQCVKTLLLVFVLSHVAFGLHASMHVSGEGIDCGSCSSHANTPVAITSSPLELRSVPALVFDCEYPATIAPDDTYSSLNSRGPPQLS